jgi:hypothetical protein
MHIPVADVRRAARHFLTPEIASAAGLTLQELQSFAAGSHALDQNQLCDLARRIEMEDHNDGH